MVPRALRSTAVLVATLVVAATAVALFVSSHGHRKATFERFAPPPPPPPAAGQPAAGQPAPPRPLLDLALERIASSRGQLVARHSVLVERADRIATGASGASGVRWTAKACFFGPDDGFGRCARLVVFTQTTPPTPPLPPTQWPFALEAETALPDVRPASELLLLLPGAPPQ
jgi:hypothetical protein